MLALLFIGQLVTWWSMARGDRNKAVQLGESAAKSAENVAADLRAAAASSDRLARALESLQSWATGHDLDDARFQEKTIAVQGQMAEAITRLTTMQENLGNQIVNVATGRAMQAEAETVAPNAARPRRAPHR
jgi:hypothetical protein